MHMPGLILWQFMYRVAAFGKEACSENRNAAHQVSTGLCDRPTSVTLVRIRELSKYSGLRGCVICAVLTQDPPAAVVQPALA